MKAIVSEEIVQLFATIASAIARDDASCDRRQRKQT
jgi:hypothetical protein